MPLSRARGTLAAVQARWIAWWFGPADPRPLAMVRIGLAVVAIWTHLSWWPEVDTLLAPDGMSRLVVSPEHGRGLTVFALPGVDAHSAPWLHAATLLPLVALLLGLGGRWTAILAWLVVVGWYHRTPGASTGGDRLLRFALLYLAVGGSTAVWSVDAWWAARRGRQTAERVSGLPLRLLQVQWAAMYLISGLEKARGSTWRDGTALHYALSNRTFSRLPGLLDPALALPSVGLVLQLATWAVVAWELAFAPLVAGRRTRGTALLIGVFIHVGIGVTMEVGPFTAVTLVGYLAFLDRPGGLGGRLGLAGAPATRVQSSGDIHEHQTAPESVPQESP